MTCRLAVGFLAVAALAVPSRSNGQLSGVQVETDPTGASTIEFTAEWPSSLTASLDSVSADRLTNSVALAVSHGDLVASGNVDVPPGSDPRVSVVASDFEEVSLAPGDPALALELSGSVVTLDAIGYFRKRRIGTVSARLLTYDASRGVLRRYQRIVVRVSGIAESQVGTFGKSVTNPHLAVDRSHLADGRVFKIPIAEEGLYRIDRQLVLELGLDPDAVDPDEIQVLGNGGAPVAARNRDPRFADLVDTAVLVAGGGDGSFGSGDAVYFFASGPYGWHPDADGERWEHYVHPFDGENYVFIKVGQAHPIATVPFGTTPASTVLSEVEGRLFADQDVFLWSKEHGSGLTWVSNPIREAGKLSVLQGVTLPGFTGGSLTLTANVAIQSNPIASVDFLVNGSLAGSIRAPYSISSGAERPIAAPAESSFDVTLSSGGPLTVEMALQNQSGDPQAALDWLRIRYPQSLTADNGFLRFASPPGVSGRIEFVLSGFSSPPDVWDVTSPDSYRRFEVSAQGGTYRVRVNVADPARPIELLAWSSQAARSVDPTNAVEIAHQNLHGLTTFPELVIVTPGIFEPHSTELANRRREEGMVVEVVNVEQIYNEFSGGQVDFRGIRDYLKFLYDRAPADQMLRYVLLFGDGHYDYRGLRKDVAQFPNWIPPYETVESYHPDRSFTSDDYFGLLDDDEGEWVYQGFGVRSNERVDVGIGRFTVQTEFEAATVVDKIRRYEDPSAFGAWRSSYVFVADDHLTGATGARKEDDLHMQNIDSVAELVRQDLYSAVNASKIYGESYARVFTNAWRIPDAKRELLASIDDGTLIVNYAGHGGPSGLAQEEVFTREDALALTNGDRQPIFVTATCSFGWWDIDDFQSGAEVLLTNPDGGAVAMLTTVRLVYTSSDTSSLNPGLNRALNRGLFRRSENGQWPRLGDAMLETKNTGVGLLGNSRKFNLLGDPSMRLGLPAAEVVIEDVNGVPVSETTGNLRALERVTISGRVQDAGGQVVTGFSGPVEVSVFDAERRVPIRFHTFMPTPYYLVREDLIWRGEVLAADGRFAATFVVPKDISYSDDYGRISAYGASAEGHALGYTENFIVGGTASDPPDDSEGPSISLFLNDSTFVSGGLVNQSPKLLVRLADDSGINTVGAGVGHELLLVLNEDQSGAVDIGSAFRSDANSYQRGSLQWEIEDLPEGPGVLSVRAWDVLNNSSTASLEFIVAASERLEVRNVYNYPNPTSGETRFIFEHNQPFSTSANVSVRVYTLAGRPIRTIDDDEALPSGVLTGAMVSIPWDGRDDDGDRIATGVYLYKLRVEVDGEDGERQVSERIEKLAIIR